DFVVRGDWGLFVEARVGLVLCFERREAVMDADRPHLPHGNPAGRNSTSATASPRDSNSPPAGRVSVWKVSAAWLVLIHHCLPPLLLTVPCFFCALVWNTSGVVPVQGSVLHHGYQVKELVMRFRLAGALFWVAASVASAQHGDH